MSFNHWHLRVAADAPAGGLAPRRAKVIPRDEEPEVTPIAWRPVHSPQEPAKSVVEAPEIAAQLAQLRLECERKVKDAHASGFREGEAAGRSRAMTEVQPVIERLVRTIEEIAQLRHRLRREAEADTIKLSLAIARRVLHRELAMDPDALRGLVLAAVEKLHSQEISRVKAHPAHAPQIAALLRSGPLHTNAEVTPDPSLQPGGVVFETNHGNLDASIDSQLQEIERGLTDRLRGTS